MKYPCLVPKALCETYIEAEIEQEGLNNDSEPFPPARWSGKCNYQDGGRTVFTAEKKLIQLSGCVLIPGDIAPDIPVISGGIVKIFNVERHIYKGTKARNPDGTVNYTRLEVE